MGCLGVSTHAPARGATSAPSSHAINPRMFQPTRPRGARPVPSPSKGAFQRVSTHAPTRDATTRHARRRWSGRVSTHAPARDATGAGRTSPPGRACFNPRAREGRDLATCLARYSHPMFQPTRPRGARHAQPIQGRPQNPCFNPRACGGATRTVRALRVGPVVSIHAPAGGRHSGINAMHIGGQFQSTRPRRARLASTRIAIATV